MCALSLSFFLFAAAGAVAQSTTNWTASPFNPPSLPLAVKGPYLNSWAPLGFGGAAPFNCCSAAVDNAWPRLWDKTSTALGWSAFARVDGTGYRLLGQSDLPIVDAATQKSFLFTPTRTTYVLQAGSVDIKMTFLSPVEPDDLVRQSMPFSYMHITVESNDGNSHDVQIYSDVTGEWISGDPDADANWSINESSNLIFLQMALTSPQPYTETNNRPQDAMLYHCMEKSDKVSWQIAFAYDTRSSFVNGTGLSETSEDGHHGINNPSNALAIAYDFGSISSSTDPVVFALGVVRDPVIKYTNAKAQIEERSAYYWSNFSNIHDVIEDVLDHFDDAVATATALDNQLLSNAGQISSNYGDILSLATRQAWGALEYTLAKDNGVFNMSDVKVFMKDMGGVGSGGVNAVDVIYAAMPVYLYFNPAILGYLLSPLMDYQESVQYTNAYAAQDLGRAFPVANGNPQGHDQKIEQSANMLIMSLAHAQGSGDGNLLAQHYDLLKGWATYLANNTMDPEDQTTSISDGIQGTNQTNLILKGVIGIGAMAKISEYMNRTDDHTHFDGIAKDYAQRWTTFASDSGQLSLHFGSSSSGLIYNLYADKLLQLDLLNSSVYDLQALFYEKQTTLSTQKYGISLDASNSSSLTRSDWMMFAASSVSGSSRSVSEAMISQVHAYAAVNMQNSPFTALYNAADGSQLSGEASPAQGAMFAPLALGVALRSVTFSGAPDAPDASDNTHGHSSNKSVIAGAAVGGVALFAIVCGILAFFWRRRRVQRATEDRRTTFADRIQPAPLTSDTLIEPPYVEAVGPSVVQRPSIMPFVLPIGKGQLPYDSSGSSTVSTSQLLPSSSSGQYPDGLRTEVDYLRNEIERMKVERAVSGEAPPVYYEDVDGR